MDSNYYDRNSLYDYVYIICKSVILLIVTTVISLLSFGILLPIVVVIISNFIEGDYEYNKLLVKGLTIKNILLLLLFSILFHVVAFVYLNSSQVYSGSTLSIIRGLNLFVMFEMLLALMYAPKFIYNRNQKLISALKDSLVIGNYKIAISMLTAIVLLFISLFLITVFKGKFMLLNSTLIVIWQIISSKLYKRYIVESEV